MPFQSGQEQRHSFSVQQTTQNEGRTFACSPRRPPSQTKALVQVSVCPSFIAAMKCHQHDLGEGLLIWSRPALVPITSPAPCRGQCPGHILARPLPRLPPAHFFQACPRPAEMAVDRRRLPSLSTLDDLRDRVGCRRGQGAWSVAELLVEGRGCSFVPLGQAVDHRCDRRPSSFR